MTEKQLNDDEVRNLKQQVLNEHRDFLRRELGDPARYLPYLRSRGVLDEASADEVKSKTTPSDKVDELVNALVHCSESYDAHPLDVLIEGIKRQKVQLHISRVLQKAVSKLRTQSQMPYGESPQRDIPVESDSAFSALTPRSEFPRSDSSNSGSQESFAVTGGGPDIRSDNGQYDIHPEYGPLPNPPPPALKVQGPTADDHSTGDDVHPEFGPLPSLPPSRHSHSNNSGTLGNSLVEEQVKQRGKEEEEEEEVARTPLHGAVPFCPPPAPTASLTPYPTISLASYPPPIYSGCAHSDDIEYYRTQLEQKVVDSRVLQRQLEEVKEENERLKGRIDALERELTLVRQGRVGGATRPSHLPFTRSPDPTPGHPPSSGWHSMSHASSSSPASRGSTEHHSRHEKHSLTPNHHHVHKPKHGGVAVSSRQHGAQQSKKSPAPISTPHNLACSVNDCTTDV